MSITDSELRILLIQARDEQEILRQEVDCFIERCNINENEIKPVNVITYDLKQLDLEAFDAMMIGGSGAYSAAMNYAWMPALLELVQKAAYLSFPTFGSCWGHQVIARALGGEVRYDRQLTEIGCHWVWLNQAGMQDPLFKDFPNQFKANMGHHDRVVRLPPGAIDLAYSETQPHQAFRIEGKPIYGTQFHSELNAEREKERLHTYRSYYTEVESEEMFQEILDSLANTTEVDSLLSAFLQLFVVRNTAY